MPSQLYAFQNVRLWPRSTKCLHRELDEEFDSQIFAVKRASEVLSSPVNLTTKLFIYFSQYYDMFCR